MLNHIKMRFFHIIEMLTDHGLSYFCKEILFFNRKCILLERELTNYTPSRTISQHINLRLVEIDTNNLNEKQFSYQSKTRYLKAIGYAKKGYFGYGIARNNEIVGDIWCFTPKKSVHTHPDLNWLGIECPSDHCYSFDMYLSPKERGNKNLAIFFENAFLSDLQKKGFGKVYGFVWADNIPALWTHRVAKWQETGKLSVCRFLTFRTVGYKRGYD